MNGSEKNPLLVTEKSENPMHFEHVKSLSFTYRHNSSTWMTCTLHRVPDMFGNYNGSQKPENAAVFKQACTTTS
jgi:hypothetical protein